MCNYHFKRGIVFEIWHPPDDPSRKEEKIKKYVLNLQEGIIVENRDFFCGLLMTTGKAKLEKPLPWDVVVSKEESGTEYGVVILCDLAWTIKKSNIIKPAYEVSVQTMRDVDHRLYYSLCLRGAKFEDVEELL